MTFVSEDVDGVTVVTVTGVVTHSFCFVRRCGGGERGRVGISDRGDRCRCDRAQKARPSRPRARERVFQE